MWETKLSVFCCCRWYDKCWSIIKLRRSSNTCSEIFEPHIGYVSSIYAPETPSWPDTECIIIALRDNLFFFFFFWINVLHRVWAAVAFKQQLLRLIELKRHDKSQTNNPPTPYTHTPHGVPAVSAVNVKWHLSNLKHYYFFFNSHGFVLHTLLKSVLLNTARLAGITVK